MSLKSALLLLPLDRETSCATRDVLDLFRRHPDEWFRVAQIAGSVNRSSTLVGDILEVLRGNAVLDFDSTVRSYRYRRDTLLDIEIDRFVRRVEGGSNVVQSNVERFRQRYGAR